jgi:hypothetical protein
MKLFEFSEAHAKSLQEQVIDAQQPGTILRDFGMLLDFVQERAVKVAGKYNLLPIDAISELDARLSRPLRLALKRPQLRSQPYVQGLYLLLRATGLSRIEGSGTKARLVLDPVMFEQWKQLNPTEQYFNLLEAWLLHGRAEMVGERGDSWGEDSLMKCVGAWRSIPPKEGRSFTAQRPEWVHIDGIYREFYHVALLDLFGLMQVEHPTEPVQPWHPAGLKRRPFGDALFSLLGQWYMDGPGRPDLDEEASPDFGVWQPLLQPYFPEWRANLALPEPERRKGIFVFKVSLGKVWRRIAMPDQATLDELVGLILRSVNFDSDHLYEFTYRDRFGATVRVAHPYCDDAEAFANEVEIGEVPLELGQSMQLLYDFGDNWQFTVTLERIDPPGKKRSQAGRILERHGKAPRQYPDVEDDWE